MCRPYCHRLICLRDFLLLSMGLETSLFIQLVIINISDKIHRKIDKIKKFTCGTISY